MASNQGMYNNYQQGQGGMYNNYQQGQGGMYTPPSGNTTQYNNNAGKPQPQYDYAAPVPNNACNNPGAAYPQAVPYVPDPSVPPADGQPLYTQAQGQANPHLRRFVKKGWKDVWAAVLFMLFFIMTFVWGIVNMITYKPKTISITKSDFFGTDKPLLLMCAVILAAFAVSVVAAGLGVALLTCFPKAMIYIANILVIIMMIGSTVLCYMYGTLLAGIIMTVLTLLHILWFYCARRRIAFAAAVLRAATQVVSTYKAIFGFKFLMLIVLIVYAVFWSFATLRSVDHAQDGTFTGFDTFVILLFVFTYYWVMQVIPNVMLVTTAGVTATWYFVGKDNMPPNPTVSSFGRAVTTSFGSICFGSLIVAIIQFLRFLAESSRRNGEGNLITCCLICLLACIESIAEYFNTYAYVHIAMYGYDYITAAKHTFELFKQCLFAALFNDCLINPTLNILSLVLSAIIGVIFGLVLWSIPIGVIAFLVSVMVHNLFYTAVSSAVVTIFVCFAEVPEALRQTDPELYDTFVSSDQGGTNNRAGARV